VMNEHALRKLIGDRVLKAIAGEDGEFDED
jgi:hypothetical protein